ncbi:MFS transporter [Streptomyces sp. NPDC088846]|uniref:MFS transporter n=1 Tax=Streptomyces sp. NPDC088846 TaxID=3365908 RepID=UPI0038020376
MSTSETTPVDTGQTRSGALPGQGLGITLAVIVTCQLMVAIDGTVMNVALPSLRESLNFSATSLSWVPTAYTLAFGGLLLLGGRAGDVLGRRRVFVAGVLVFTLASLLGGLAPTAGWLIAARVLQGAGAAMCAPSTLALLTTNFTEGAQRNRALGVFSTVAGLGLAIGLILGGVLTEWASWRWALLINVPFGIAIAVLAPKYVKEPPRQSGRFDTSGTLLSAAGMGLLVYGLIRVAEVGWGSTLAVSLAAAGVVLLAVFVLVERGAQQPIMPLRLFADRTRASAYLNMLLLVATMTSMFFFLVQFMGDILDFSPMISGVAFLPMAGALFVSGRTAPKLLPKFGAKKVMIGGAVAIVAGVAWLATISADTSYAAGVLGPLILFGTGIGFSFMPLNMTILGGVPPRDVGAASGLLQAMQQVGGSVGLAVLVTVFGSVSRDSAEKPRGVGRSLEVHAHIAEADGMSSAFAAGTVFAVLALLVVAFAIRIPKPKAAA